MTLAALLSPVDVIDTLAEAFRLLAAGGAAVPPRGTLGLAPDAVLLTMPAAVVPDGVADSAGVKLVTYHGGNRATALPTLHSTYVLLDGGTGRPLALLEGPRAVLDADLVTCATTSPTPVLAGADLRPGTHLDAVGAFRPTERELTATPSGVRVVVDTYARALAEAGDILIPLAEGVIDRDHIAAERAELVTSARPGRTSAEEITIFKSVGLALEDVATARLAYNRAMASGAGSRIDL